MKKKILSLLVFLIICVTAVIPAAGISAADAGTITVGKTDYDEMTMRVYMNGNSICYFSTDAKKTWNELEGDIVTDSTGSYKIMDISWASVSADVTVCFKGDKNVEVTEAVLPKQSVAFKVKYLKASGDFEFSGNDDFSSFMWRKSTDYNWKTVPFDEKSTGYKAFLKEIEGLKLKGAKLVFRTAQIAGTDADNMGERPGRDISISITKRTAAPVIKVNVNKMTLNTKASMEYFNVKTSAWEPCEKNMTLAAMVPDVLFNNGAKKTSVKIRNAETATKPYSNTFILTVPGQGTAPSVGTDVTCAFEEGKLALTFVKASATVPYEYCVVAAGSSFDESTAKWKTVKKAKTVKITQKAAPDGSTVYFRYKGIAANDAKKIALALPSYYCTYSVKWPAAGK